MWKFYMILNTLVSWHCFWAASYSRDPGFSHLGSLTWCRVAFDNIVTWTYAHLRFSPCSRRMAWSVKQCHCPRAPSILIVMCNLICKNLPGTSTCWKKLIRQGAIDSGKAQWPSADRVTYCDRVEEMFVLGFHFGWIFLSYYLLLGPWR